MSTTKTHRTTYHAEIASGRRRGWGRLITGIASDSARGAKAFTGHYLEDGIEVDLPIGALILEMVPDGSVKNREEIARFLRVDPECPSGFEVLPGRWNWKKQFLSVRDHARKLLAEPQPELEPDELEPDEVETLLSGIPTEQLQAELARRGITT